MEYGYSDVNMRPIDTGQPPRTPSLPPSKPRAHYLGTSSMTDNVERASIPITVYRDASEEEGSMDMGLCKLLNHLMPKFQYI
jgi:hypothetical protein